MRKGDIVDGLVKLIEFLNILEAGNVFYQLGKIRDGILITIVVPGERWEVEFLIDGDIDIERFVSDGNIEGEKELRCLVERFFENKELLTDLKNLFDNI